MSIGYNLVLVYTPYWFSIDDFKTIASHVRRKSENITTIIATNGYSTAPDGDAKRFDDELMYAEAAARIASARPTLVFSPGKLRGFIPLRGRIHCGRHVPKLQQLQRLHAAGLPVPLWQVLTPSAEFAPERFGPVVIVKPLAWGASEARDAQMRRTADVRYVPPDSLPKEHLGRLGPMLVQRFIDTGDCSEEIRVLTLFGEILYAERRRAGIPRPPLDAPDRVLSAAPVAITFTHRRAHTSLCFDEDVLALARQVYAVFPEVPLQACDIIRDHRDGKIYILEINPGGNTWHFSSGRARPLSDGGRREEQFQAFERAADILIERTMVEAL